MNEFRDHVDRFYVMEPNAAESPIALARLRSPEWLANFSLGELYEHEEFGAPTDVASATR
jgi:hypothetical protein